MIIRYFFLLISIVLEIVLLSSLDGKIGAGDHIDYRKYYDLVGQQDLNTFSINDSINAIGSIDYLYNFIIFIFSRYVNFDVFVFFINLCYFLFVLLLFSRMKLYFIAPLLPFSFYIVGIQYSAQRLLLAITIFGLSFIYGKKIITLSALLIHAQILPLFFLYMKYVKKINILFAAIFFIFLAVYFDLNAVQKFILYATNREKIVLQDFLLIISFYMAVKISLKDKDTIIFNAELIFLLLFLLVIFLGSGRLNIIAFFVTLIILSTVKSVDIKSKVFLLLFMMYDIAKGFMFISGVLDGNSGFDAISFFE